MLYQFLPRLADEEYAALEHSIREHGVQVPIVVDEHRAVIDGHHRKEIAERLGIECPRRLAMDLTDEQKRTLSLSLNLDRRHLNREQKRELVERSLKADPQLSNLQHAGRTGVSDKTVAARRAELEQRSEIPNGDMRVDSSGRPQPASKPPRPTPSVNLETGEVSADYELPAEPVATGDDAGEAEPEGGDPAPVPSVPVERPRPPVTGLDGKTYQPPAPKPTRATPRRALPDQFFDAAYDMSKAIEKVARLTADDRFPQNIEKVAAKHRNDLLRSRDLLQQVIDRLDSES